MKRRKKRYEMIERVFGTLPETKQMSGENVKVCNCILDCIGADHRAYIYLHLRNPRPPIAPFSISPNYYPCVLECI